MLTKLEITNFTLIDKLEMEFDTGINILTGETGAGKSIILGAIGLILGQRAEANMLVDPNRKCVIEATFLLQNPGLRSFFETNDLDYEEHTLIRREILPSGKSRAFINDCPVILPVLKELSSLLVNLIAQHQTLFLHQRNFKYRFLDVVAGQENLVAEFRELYRHWKKENERLQVYLTAQREWQKEMDYVRFQLDEFQKAALMDENEQDLLENDLKKLEHASELQFLFSESLALLGAEEGATLALLFRAKTALQKAGAYDRSAVTLVKRLEGVYEEIKDISSETENLAEKTETDPEKIQKIHDRLDILYRMQKKFGCTSVSELQAIESDLIERARKSEQDAAEIDKLQTHISELEKKLTEQAYKLGLGRDKAAIDIKNQMDRLLPAVAMKDASFAIALSPAPLNDMGADEIKLLFTANKGKSLEEVQNVASGGELSRLMLCIQAILSQATDLPTLIMDEIDSGISGETALKTAKVMKQIGAKHQLLLITHLPQIAACGERHFLVYKTTDKERTLSQVRLLTPSDREIEIAKMISGEKPSDSALKNARELLAL